MPYSLQYHAIYRAHITPSIGTQDMSPWFTCQSSRGESTERLFAWLTTVCTDDHEGLKASVEARGY